MTFRGVGLEAVWIVMALAAPAGAQPAAPGGGGSVATADDGGFRFVWDDRPSLRAGKWLRVDLRLKVQADVRSSEQDLAEYGGTFELTRLRAGVKGEVTRYVEFEVEHDLTSDGQWRDVYANVKPLREAQLKAGKFKIPFSLEQTTGPMELDFVSRSLAARVLAPGRDVGVMAHGSVLKGILRYEIGYFQGDGDNPPPLKPMPYPLPEDPAPEYGPSLAGRLRVEPFRGLSKKSLVENLEVGFAATSTEIPVGPNHLQGESVFGYEFFPRQVLHQRCAPAAWGGVLLEPRALVGQVRVDPLLGGPCGSGGRKRRRPRQRPAGDRRTRLVHHGHLGGDGREEGRRCCAPQTALRRRIRRG